MHVVTLMVGFADFQNIKQGKYVAPWDMTPGHRQFNPLFVLRRGFNFLGEAVDTLRRRCGSQCVKPPVAAALALLRSAFTCPAILRSSELQTTIV